MQCVRLRRAAGVGRSLRWGTALVGLLLGVTAPAGAQTSDVSPADSSSSSVFPHSETSAWWLSGQLNVIAQGHGRFPSAYAGDHSLQSAPERATSRVWTAHLGVQLPRRMEVLVDVESAGGGGLSDALGVAGFTNLDVVRNPDLGSAPYLARAVVHYTLGLSHDTVRTSRGPLGLATERPTRRLDVRLGKLSLADYFDVNAVGSDSHLQFMNWAIDNNGAYDYAADTRGYTYGAIVEYDARRWSLRAAEALMPTVANGITLDRDLSRARGENAELELRPAESVTLRLLGYANHANMGRYQDATDAFLRGEDPRPDIEGHRQQGRVKTGVGANFEYDSRRGFRLFGRTGWNEGQFESFAYTEVNNTLSAGADVGGAAWHRHDDRVGMAFASNGLSSAHQTYLHLGGMGFLLGDGGLTYGREDLAEAYYTARLGRGVSASVDGQHLTHPGYNRDRGPAFVGSVRLHVDF
jgi:high affinity Mn2+ porin